MERSQETKLTLEPVIFRKTEEGEEVKKCACIVVTDTESAHPDLELENALESLHWEVCYSSDGCYSTDGHKLPEPSDKVKFVFVLYKFEGEVYDYVMAVQKQNKFLFGIVGPPCVYTCRRKKIQLPKKKRPTYCSIMRGTVICFTGFASKKDLDHLNNLAHLMGASTRQNHVPSVTHVVAADVNGSQCQDAVGRGIPIMSDEWITECWRCRDDHTASALEPPLSEYKQLPFTGCVFALYGFREEEEAEMKEIAVSNGAVTRVVGESGVTHLVVSDDVDPAHFPVTRARDVVKQQWFWESIQIEAKADEKLYMAKESSYHQHHRRNRRRGRPSSNSFLQSSISSMDVSCLLEASLFSLSSPALPKSLGKTKKSPGGLSPLVGVSTASSGACSSSTHQKTEDSARRHIAMELLQTEKNFVDILDVIVKVFKEPLEELEQSGRPILNHENIKSIFGNVSEILSVHKHLVAGLEEHLENWRESCCIGQVVLKQSDALLRVYPPFVNFFDLSKEALQKCDKTFPRFHAFLKSNESKPECGRQTLTELLITPVQRIPRIILLLKDLIKRTGGSHPDYTALQQAEESLKTVMNHINEDRRKTEGQMQMFEVQRDVEGCPANILSSHRSFVRRLDVLDIGNPGKGTKGDPITIFVFSDSLEVAKRRMTSGFALRTPAKFKHLEFVPLTNVRSIVQFGDTGEYSNSFGILLHGLDDPMEKLLVFRLAGESGAESKAEVVQLLAKLLADSIFSTNVDEFIVNSSADVLNSLCKTSVSSTTLKKALHGARKKVRRAFSGKHGRKQTLSSSSSVHHSIGEENEIPLDMPESPNTSISSNASTLTFATPVASLRTPRPKRPALSRLPSFSAADLTNLGTEV